jgi:hypothetical protein
MPDDDDLVEDEDQEQEQEDPKAKNREAFLLRKAQTEAKKAQDALSAMQRERAFEKAGIDPEDPKFTYFIKGYEGELTADAVKAEAMKVGLLEAPKDPDPKEDANLANQKKILDAAGGALPPQTGLAAMAQEQLDAFNSGEGGNTPALLEVLQKQGIPVSLDG